VSTREVRIARPTNDLAAIRRFWVDAVGLDELGGFADEEMDGLFVGPRDGDWHLELTFDRRRVMVPQPTSEDLIVLYLGSTERDAVERRLVEHGIATYDHPNHYWASVGATCYLDPDGYGLVISSERPLRERSRHD
jgi:hypothetical protein